MWALTKGNWLHYPINDNNIRNNSIPTGYITLLSVNFPLQNWSHKPNDNIISDHITLWPTDIKMISQIQLQKLIRVYLEKQTNYSIFKVICNLCYKSCQSLAQSFPYNKLEIKTNLILFRVLLARVYDGRDLLDAGHEDEDVAPFAVRILVVNQLKNPDIGSRIQFLRWTLLHGRDRKELKKYRNQNFIQIVFQKKVLLRFWIS